MSKKKNEHYTYHKINQLDEFQLSPINLIKTIPNLKQKNDVDMPKKSPQGIHLKKGVDFNPPVITPPEL